MDGRPFPWRATAAYAGMIGGAVTLFFWVCRLGVGLAPPALPALAPSRAVPTAAPDGLMHVLLALLVVILAARTVGWLCARWGQPPVIGEVVAGILLGPSLLGRLAPGVGAFLFPPAVVPVLGALSQIGIVLFMFVVGVQMDTAHMRRRRRSALAISHASIVAPFVLGSTLALALYPRLSAPGVSFATFALFLGVAMSVTAFPVLARILTDRGLQQTEMGSLAIGCAAVDDATAWCLLALVAGVARGQVTASVLTIALAAAYVAAMLAAGRPLLRRALAADEAGGPPRRRSIALLLVGLLASALTAEVVGIHAVFGAFLFGAVVPRGSRVARELAGRLEDLVAVLLLPAFFLVTGLRTEMGLVRGLEEWLPCLAIIAVACLGKFGGTFLAARVTGMAWRPAAFLGVLMNTRGLMELIVLNMGLEMGILSPPLFAMMVFMAVTTTVATAPLLVLLERMHGSAREGTAEKAPA